MRSVSVWCSATSRSGRTSRPASSRVRWTPTSSPRPPPGPWWPPRRPSRTSGCRWWSPHRARSTSRSCPPRSCSSTRSAATDHTLQDPVHIPVSPQRKGDLPATAEIALNGSPADGSVDAADAVRVLTDRLRTSLVPGARSYLLETIDQGPVTAAGSGDLRRTDLPDQALAPAGEPADHRRRSAAPRSECRDSACLARGSRTGSAICWRTRARRATPATGSPRGRCWTPSAPSIPATPRRRPCWPEPRPGGR